MRSFFHNIRSRISEHTQKKTQLERVMFSTLCAAAAQLKLLCSFQWNIFLANWLGTLSYYIVCVFFFLVRVIISDLLLLQLISGSYNPSSEVCTQSSFLCTRTITRRQCTVSPIHLFNCLDAMTRWKKVSQFKYRLQASIRKIWSAFSQKPYEFK